MRDDLVIALVQANLHWEDKAANLEMLEQKIAEIKGKAELIVLPEMFSTGFSMQPEIFAETMEGHTVSWLKTVAAANRIALTGSVIIKENERFYNRLIWMLPNGSFGVYDKRHRFAFAGEDEYYASGTKRFLASLKGWRINLQICYDLRFPVWARQAKAEGGAEYDVLVYVANWPEKRIHAWKTLLMARAIENQCYVIGVNRIGEDGNGIQYSGQSMVIDPVGEVVHNMQEKEGVGIVTLSKDFLYGIREKFPFLKDADHFGIVE